MSDNVSTTQIIERLFEMRRKYERFALLYVHVAQHAQDIVMESFVSLWENRDQLDKEKNPEAYLLRIIKNKSLDYLRHIDVRRTVEANMRSDAQWELDMSIATLQAFDPDWLFDEEIQRRFREALKAMPEATRRVFEMSRSEGLSYAQIAELLGVSVKTVEYRMSSALRMLRLRFKDMYIFWVFLLID